MSRLLRIGRLSSRSLYFETESWMLDLGRDEGVTSSHPLDPSIVEDSDQGPRADENRLCKFFCCLPKDLQKWRRCEGAKSCQSSAM